MRLIELDGRCDGPMDHGPVKDFLKVRNIHRVFQALTLVADPLLCSCSLCEPLPIGRRQSRQGGFYGHHGERGIWLVVFGSPGLKREITILSRSFLFLPRTF